MRLNKTMNKRGLVNICDVSKNFEYDKEIDSLYIYNNDQSEEIIGSIPIGNLIFDIGTSGRLVGLEIDNASSFLNIDPKLLMNIKTAKIWVKKQGNILSLGFSIMAAKETLNYAYMISKDKIAMTC